MPAPACSVVVLVLLTGPALLGTISFVVPVLIVAAALLVIDVGVRASLAGDAVASAALAALFPVLGGGGPGKILLFAIPWRFSCPWGPPSAWHCPGTTPP